MKQYGHVSYERVVSGMGLENIYSFCAIRGVARNCRKLPKR